MKSLIVKIIPKTVKKRLYAAYLRRFKDSHYERYLRREKEIPSFELEYKHLKDLKALPSRLDLIKTLPSKAVVAEIGVDYGGFSEDILKYSNPRKLHLIDAWDSNRYNKIKKTVVQDKFENQLGSGQVFIHEGYSTQVVKNFQNDYFDWIYIDTDHSYGTTKAELELYAPKIKKGGIMAGHDYETGHWKSLFKFGVIEAVHEFCAVHNWKIVFLTMETREHNSFAIQKIE